MVVSMRCETIKIISDSSPGGFVVINKSDFDESKHKLFGVENAEQKKVRKRKTKKEVAE